MNATLLAFLAPLGPFALLLLMLVAFAETGLLAGFLLPADTLLVTAGVLVAAGGLHLPVWLSLAAVSLAAVAGDQLAYLVGRRLGPRLQQGRGSRVVSPQRLERARVFFDRHGSKSVVLSRFVPLARTLTPVLAGLGGMDRRKFLLHNVVGAVGWAVVMFGGGYWLGAIPIVASNLELILLTMVAFSVLPVVASLVRAQAASRSVRAVRRPPPGQE
ncbi:MAG: VTT domain-containing protein [Dermatophilaceae bacterium]